MQPFDMDAHPAQHTILDPLLAVGDIDDVEDLHLELADRGLVGDDFLLGQERVVDKVARKANRDAANRLVLVVQKVAEE